MSEAVVDASVVAAAFFQEQHADHARGLLEGEATLLAPDLIYAELANVIWKRHSRGEILLDKARSLFDDIRNVPLEITAMTDLIEPALEISLRSNHPVYDCLYLALAMRNHCPLITADQRLLKFAAAKGLGKHVQWVAQSD
ncbi:MAG: type II toxin-antitoxin system VapC family toxin [Planctomycetaceae bacterium]|nr:type II toxin-antitoxin system VapC family toxin [Planctomycetaceae bacterium]